MVFSIIVMPSAMDDARNPITNSPWKKDTLRLYEPTKERWLVELPTTSTHGQRAKEWVSFGEIFNGEKWVKL